MRRVLLTGANGYLGRFLCLEWLQRLRTSGDTLTCVVRGDTAAFAAGRLDEAFDSGDAELLRRYRDLADGTLEVLAGDLAAPRLGLDEDTWAALADTVDLIVHPGALVNHVLPYAELFGPNVAGTAEVIRLALTTRIKAVSYVSTIGVRAGAPAAALDEDADIRVTMPTRRIDQGYASGYATSKWAGEVLLREAHQHYGLPVATFRPDMILAHSRYAGQLNVSDLVTRLLLSVVATGLAPGSFYQAGARAHYDGLPVDFVAAAITSLGASTDDGYRTVNVLNPYDDGVSLDTFVDWLIEAGHPIHRIDDYDEWLARIATAIRALPAKQGQRALLPLLDAFARPADGIAGSAIPGTRFHDAPHLSADLIGKYVTDLRRLDLL